MKKIVLILLISVSMVFGDIGKITGTKGEVFVKRASKTLVASVGFVLQKDDEITTKDKSKVLVLFNDGTSVTVGKDSTMRVNEYVQDATNPKNNKANIGFGKGVFRTITGKIGKANPDGFKLETKSASLGIRGSDGTTLVNENGTMKHTTNDGGFYIVNKATGESFEVPKGTTAHFVESGEIEVKTTTQADIEEAEEVAEETPAEVVNQEAKEEQKEEVNEEAKDELQGSETSDTPKEENLAITETPTEQTNFEGSALEETADAPLVDTPVTNSKIKNLLLVNTNETINTNPILSYEVPEIYENESGIISLVGIDADRDTLDYEIVSNPRNGVATLDVKTGKITYTPNLNYDGTETLIVKVSDGNGGSDTKTITFVVQNALVPNVQAYTPQGELADLMVDLSTLTKEIIGSDTYYNTNILEYGYIVENTQKTATYITGIPTPSVVVEQYILTQQTANYSGNVASFVNGIATNGTINLNMNFGNKNFTGAINVGDNWKANINSGTISPYGFNTTNISAASGSSIQNITGSLVGKYYGPTASSVGGTFNLSSGSNSVNGVFGGAKQ